nr:MAG TPA: hypothetical protein [Caudoviricetes sp.]
MRAMLNQAAVYDGYVPQKRDTHQNKFNTMIFIKFYQYPKKSYATD